MKGDEIFIDEQGNQYTADQVVYRSFQDTLTKFDGYVTLISAEQSDNPACWVKVAPLIESVPDAVAKKPAHDKKKNAPPKLFSDGSRIYYESAVVLVNEKDFSGYVTKTSYERSDSPHDWHVVKECVRLRLPVFEAPPQWQPRIEEMEAEPLTYRVESQSAVVPEGHDWREYSYRVELVGEPVFINGVMHMNGTCSCEGMDKQLYKRIGDGHLSRCKHFAPAIRLAYEKLVVFWARKHNEILENKTTPKVRAPFQKP